MTALTFSYAVNLNATASVNGLPSRLSASPATVPIGPASLLNVTLVVMAPNQLDTATYVFTISRLPDTAEAEFITVRK